MRHSYDLEERHIFVWTHVEVSSVLAPTLPCLACLPSCLSCLALPCLSCLALPVACLFLRLRPPPTTTRATVDTHSRRHPPFPKIEQPRLPSFSSLMRGTLAARSGLEYEKTRPTDVDRVLV